MAITSLAAARRGVTAAQNLLACGPHERNTRAKLGGTMATKAKDGSSGGPGPKKQPPGNIKKINLALQGGGAHGAFAWGVLDRLLEQEELEIDGLVGTSAGAMNAAATAYGITIGGREGARHVLATFWK